MLNKCAACVTVMLAIAGPVSGGGLLSAEMEANIEAPVNERAEEALLDRAAEYQEIVAAAKARGTLVGALQGAVIVGALSGEVGGFVIGGLLGGALGSYSSERTITSFILEHQNYEVKRDSLNALLTALEDEKTSSSFDLVLSTKYVDSLGSDKASDAAKQSIRLFRDVSIARELAVREIRQIEALPPSFNGIENLINDYRMINTRFTGLIAELR